MPCIYTIIHGRNVILIKNIIGIHYKISVIGRYTYAPLDFIKKETQRIPLANTFIIKPTENVRTTLLCNRSRVVRTIIRYNKNIY